jgi:RpiB/LacA/LacB family sugar-phosphate isomerase
MRVAVACDHGGFSLKGPIIKAIQCLGHEPIDLGAFNEDKTDYPDYAQKAGEAILTGKADRAVVICGSGVGACIAANKMKGIYACLCHDTYSAHQGVEHDYMNVLCLGARIVGVELAAEIVKNFLSAKFLNTGNYLRRFKKILNIENTNLRT